MTLPGLLVTVAGLLVAADDPLKIELGKYQGTWVLISEEYEGEAVPDTQLRDLSYTVVGNRVLFTSNGKDHSATVRMDPSKTPGTYDLLRDDGRVSMAGIYTWDGENIKICSADDQGDRPRAFKTEPGSKNRIRVWKRKK